MCTCEEEFVLLCCVLYFGCCYLLSLFYCFGIRKSTNSSFIYLFVLSFSIFLLSFIVPLINPSLYPKALRNDEAATARELAADRDQDLRLSKAQAQLAKQLEAVSSAKRLVSSLGPRLRALRRLPLDAAQKQQCRALTTASDLLDNRCRAAGRVVTQLEKALLEAGRLGAELRHVAEERDMLSRHALSGLANAKLVASQLEAAGTAATTRSSRRANGNGSGGGGNNGAAADTAMAEAAAEHLGHLMLANERLAVSHSNARTRREFCLSAADRLLRQLALPAQVSLEAECASLETSTAHLPRPVEDMALVAAAVVKKRAENNETKAAAVVTVSPVVDKQLVDTRHIMTTRVTDRRPLGPIQHTSQ